MPEKKSNPKQSQRKKVPQEFKTMDIQVNQFGEIVKSINVESINNFLDEKVSDKKLKKETD